MSDDALTIDELAARTGVPSRTIRFYQSRKLLPPPELKGRLALYGPAHVERLKLVAELQDRGLTIKAIGGLLGRVDHGELGLNEWLGLDEQLRRPWVDDGPRVLSGAELAGLVGELRPGRVAELVRLGLVERRGDSFLVPSAAVLGHAMKLEHAGVDLELVAGALEVLRRRLARAAEELGELFLTPAAKGKTALGPALDELRPALLDVSRVLLAQEMERVLREWAREGKTARLRR